MRQSPAPRSRRRRLLLHPMVDAVQPYSTNYDKVDGNNVIQQPWNKKDYDPRDERMLSFTLI
jgi:hypothetical protein